MTHITFLLNIIFIKIHLDHQLLRNVSLLSCVRHVMIAQQFILWNGQNIAANVARDEYIPKDGRFGPLELKFPHNSIFVIS